MTPTNEENGIDVSTTQEAVPALISALAKANMELVTPSNEPSFYVQRDPHLRLRRTLTPSSPIRGMKKYTEAQFMIDDSTGKRTRLEFTALGHEFQMDAYVWGAKEEDAEKRIVTLHGISAGASRTRWHALGDRIGKSADHTKTRFVALDWHSIDRTDTPQEEFLTMLPKHIFSAPSGEWEQELLEMYPEEMRERLKGWFAEVRECCPRSLKQGGQVLRAVIEEGLGWGVPEKPFYLCVKSWSGAVGVSMLADADESFRQNIAGEIIMHPAYYLEDEEVCKNAVKDIPVLMCWTKDDLLVPYQLSSRYLTHDRVKLVTYEQGGHSNLPAFDDEVLAWLDEQELLRKTSVE